MTRRGSGRLMLAVGIGLLVLPLLLLFMPIMMAPKGTSVDFVGGSGLPLLLLAASALIVVGARICWKSGS